MKRTAWILAGGLVALLAGCGQKGALYLPDRNTRVITTPAAAQPAPAQPAAPQSGAPPSGTATPTPATAPPPKPGDKNDDDSQAPK